MASAIGLRVYLVTAHKKGDPTPLPFNSSEFKIIPPQFFTNFVTKHAEVVQNEEKERSWYFEERDNNGVGSSRGYTHYGTFGFESNFVDSKTKTRNYRRKINDIEEIPLFYEIWSPEKKNFCFAAFQSFQGRSCIELLMQQAREEFAVINPGCMLKYRKLLPSESGSIYSKAPVKSLRLIKRNAPQDITDRYLGKGAPDKINFEVRLSARRNKTLGLFGEVVGALKKGDTGLALHDGIEFSEVYADVKIGGKCRPVGVFGSDSNAGVIDITEDIARGRDGHPTYDSLKEQCNAILSDFFDVLGGMKS